MRATDHLETADPSPLPEPLGTAYALIMAAAANGATCPSNAQIAHACGYASASRGTELIARLEYDGLIRVARFQSSRIVTIVATGESTAHRFGVPHVRRGDGSGVVSPMPRRAPVKRYKQTPHDSGRGAQDWREAASLVVRREPCARCSVRSDLHDEMGCGAFADRVAVGALAL